MAYNYLAAPRQIAEFSGAGVPSVATFVGQVWVNTTGSARTISAVTLWQQTAGLSGSLVVDILVNDGGGWTSVWAVTPANRPTLPQASGSDAVATGGACDTPIVPAGAKMRMDIVQVQTGTPSNMLVQVTF